MTGLTGLSFQTVSFAFGFGFGKTPSLDVFHLNAGGFNLTGVNLVRICSEKRRKRKRLFFIENGFQFC